MRQFCLLFVCLFLFPVTRLQADKRPNIVFLLADDQAVRSMGCYHAPGARTPHLDQLAKEGMVFDAHYDTTAICMASRVNIMTGRFEYRTGCNFEHGPLIQTLWDKSYPKLLQQAGYQTAFAGKFGFVVAPGPGQKGTLPEQDFDAWGGGPGQTSYRTARNASMKKYADRYPHSTLSYGAFGSDFIRRAAKAESPFCLSISFKAPHHPVEPDSQFDQVYQGMTFSKPANYGRQAGQHFSRQSQLGRQYERFDSWHYRDDYDRVIALYYQQIYAIDVAVGMIRTAIAEAGVEQDTVVIYTSDNGFMNGAHGYGSKVLPYEEASRVPLVMYIPGHANSGERLRCKSLTGNVDFLPTILELAGVPIPSGVDGRSLLALYDDPQAETHSSLPLINVWGPPAVHSLAVVTADAKYIYWPWAEGNFEPAEELYDLEQDRMELSNIAKVRSRKGQLLEMRALYDRWHKDWVDRGLKFHRYQPFDTIFDRMVDWQEKRVLYQLR